jgi:hypothetical protein
MSDTSPQGPKDWKAYAEELERKVRELEKENEALKAAAAGSASLSKAKKQKAAKGTLTQPIPFTQNITDSPKPLKRADTTLEMFNKHRVDLVPSSGSVIFPASLKNWSTTHPLSPALTRRESQDVMASKLVPECVTFFFL